MNYSKTSDEDWPELDSQSPRPRDHFWGFIIPAYSPKSILGPDSGLDGMLAPECCPLLSSFQGQALAAYQWIPAPWGKGSGAERLGMSLWSWHLAPGTALLKEVGPVQAETEQGGVPGASTSSGVHPAPFSLLFLHFVWDATPQPDSGEGGLIPSYSDKSQ